MRKLFSLIAAVLFAGSMMAAEAIMQYTGGVTANMVGDGANNAATLGLDEDLFTVLADKGANQNFPGLNQANDIRLYADRSTGNGNTITVSIASGTITSIVLDIKQTATFVVKAGETAVTEVGGAYAINATSFSIQNTTTGATTQLRLNKITITYESGDVPPTPTMNYYVAGSMGVWGPDEAYRLTPSNNGEYEGEFTFVANDQFKVIGYDGETVTWFPEGMDNNYVITEAGDYKITFNPAGNVEGWYEGFFNVVKKEAPIVHQYEVAEAIAAGLTDDTEIMVRGVVTKMQIKGKNFANYGSACIYVKDATDAEGEFEFYNCYSFESAKFTSTIPAYDATSTAWADLTKLADANGNEIRLGDTIVAFGKYKLFNSTYELNTGCYIVDIKPAPVAPAQDINVNMSDGLMYNDYVADEGWWQIYGSNEKFDVSISNVETTQAEGTYTISDLDADYTYVGVINGNDTNYVSFVDGSVTLSIDAQTGNVTVAGTLVGNDGNNYILNLQFIVPKPTETVNVNIQNAELIDYYADDGLYGVYGTDANDIYVQIAIWAKQGFQGNFSETDLDYSNIGSAIFEGEEQVNIYTAAITVTPGNGGDYNITATLLCYNNKQYNVTMYVPAGGTAIENVDAAVKAIKRLVNGNLIIEKGNKTYNMTGVRIR
jgi:hypothetical protein